MGVVTLKDVESGGAPAPSYANMGDNAAYGAPVPGQQPYAAEPAGAEQEPPVGRWRDGMFDLLNNIAPSCVLSWIFPCIPLGQVAQKLGTYRWLNYKSVVGGYTLLYIIWFIIGTASRPGPHQASGLRAISLIMFFGLCIVAVTLRTEIRRRYSIPGSALEDSCASVWCQCCVTAQMIRHLVKYRGSFDNCVVGPNV